VSCKSLVLFFLFFLSSGVQSKTPTFSDFHIGTIYSGQNHSLNEPSSGNEDLDNLRLQASKKKANFAGHFYLYTFGCGGGAICGEVLDLKTGRVVTGLPDEYSVDDFGILFKPESSLIIIYGDGLNDSSSVQDGLSSMVRYYNFYGDVIKLIN
jgi:hypothetical protein